MRAYRAESVELPDTHPPAMVLGFGAPPESRFAEAIDVAVTAIARAQGVAAA